MAETNKAVKKSDKSQESLSLDHLSGASGLADESSGLHRNYSATLSPGVKQRSNLELDNTDNEPKVYRKLRSLTLGRRYKSKSLDGHANSGIDWTKEKKKGWWGLKFNYKLRNSVTESVELPESGNDSSCSCVCTGYRRTEEHHLGAGVVFDSSSTAVATCSDPGKGTAASATYKEDSFSGRHVREPAVNLSKFNPNDYPTEDCDEKARAQRAWEMEEGVDPPPGYQLSTTKDDNSSVELRNRHGLFNLPDNSFVGIVFHHPEEASPAFLHSQISSSSNQQLKINNEESSSVNHQVVHSQVDYIHCLVPDLLEISNCGFYWGKMDRYEAERLLENKQEGTFLLRDSAQEDYLFSVSFRRYGRSLHARIEQWNHKFSFDSHDPGVFSSDTVCGLIEHYKDPSCCMFFEPMLTIPLYRTFTFLLQHLCRSTICRMLTYDSVNQLELPKSLKVYLKEYHYKQRVRIKKLDMEQ